jgi:alpha-L-rhamnosidase
MTPSPFFRKTFRLEKPVRRARLYATALGVYEPHLNGRRIGDAVLSPGWTDYNKRVAYQTYDVTDRLRQGDNTLGAILGDGWYSGYVGFGMRRNQYGPHPRLLAQLHIEYADGGSEIVATDGGWKAATGPIRHADPQMGESYDARAEMPGWDTPGFKDAGWQAVTVEERRAGAAPPAGMDVPLVAQNCEPVQVTEELKSKAIREPAPGVYIFDLGQNMVGWVRLKVRGAAGAAVRLRFAEMLNPDSTLYTANLRGAKQTDTYILKGDGEEAWEPRFTFHGFRYVEVTGYPGKPALDALTGRVVHSATPLTGRMETSSPLVNQLLRNIDWGQRGNFLSIPTDCPQRDERLGWTGDAQIFIRTATYNRDVAAFFTKWLQDLEDAQSPAGAFPDVAPRQSYVGEGTAAWGDAGVICPWTIYHSYGDTRILERRYASMSKWVAYLQANSTDLLRPDKGYGDWLSIQADTPKDVLATAYFARSTQLLSKAARVLGKEDDARRYEALWEAIKAAFNKAYVAPDGRIKGDTQTCYVLALHFDLLPEDKRAVAARRLAADIEARGGHLSTGFVGVGYLCPVLTNMGYTDLAYRLLMNDTFPSWGYSIKHGATTIWERWDGWTEEKGFQDPDMNSFNHYSLGSVGEWLYSAVAGIDTDPEQPGYKGIRIHPRPGGGLTHVKAEYASIHGPIATDWKLEDRQFTLNVTIPANTTATVHVRAQSKDAVSEGGKPAQTAEGVTFLRWEDGYAVYAIGSGTYAFRASVP